MAGLNMCHGIPWLINGEPRPAQIEALLRSYKGTAWRDHKDAPWPEEPQVINASVNTPFAGWGHFLEPRVGKTPAVLNEYEMFRGDYGIERCLVLAPSAFAPTWVLETERFAEWLDPYLVVSGDRERQRFLSWSARADKSSEGGQVAVCGYESLLSEANRKALSDYVNDRTMIICDESIRIKNPNATFFKTVMDLGKKAAVVRALSGKPVVQGPHDLYAQLRAIRALHGVNFFQFRNRYCKMGGYKGKVIVGANPDREEELWGIRNACSWYARRRNWGTQIDGDYEECDLDLPDVLKQAYRDMEQDFLVALETGQVVTADQVITQYVKLQQISSGWIRDEEKVVRPLMDFTKTPKFMDLLDRIENRTVDKVLIAANFGPTIDMLMDGLSAYKPCVIRGKADMKKLGRDSDSEKKAFNEDPLRRLMILQTKAGKYGHTLMGTEEHPCLDFIFYENSYSLDDRAQIEERPQGEGQQDAVSFVDYVATKVEQHVLAALKRKSDVSRAILEGYGVRRG